MHIRAVPANVQQGDFTGRKKITGTVSSNSRTLARHHTKVTRHYRPQTKLRKGNVFSQGRGCLLQCMLGYTPRADTHPWAGTLPRQTPPGQTPPWADSHPWVDSLPGQQPPLGRHPLPSAYWDTPPPCPVHAGIDMATAADGTHPTGMHSCSLVF